jgi:hypothetical protein
LRNLSVGVVDRMPEDRMKTAENSITEAHVHLLLKVDITLFLYNFHCKRTVDFSLKQKVRSSV